MSESEATDGEQPTATSDYITGEEFAAYWRERVAQQNIDEGYPERNDPTYVPDDGQVSPHTLGMCKRKELYKRFNAPAEDTDPHGIFWQGKTFENEALLPALVEKYGEDRVVNDLGVSYLTTEGDILIEGTADPTILDENGNPTAQYEGKTQRSGVSKKDSPSDHHVMQLHAYMRGLTVVEGYVTYLDRATMDLKTFPVPFDPETWDDVLAWATSFTEYVRARELPPAEAEQSWECRYCDFKERCKGNNSPVNDRGWVGFAPLISYPREKVEDHLAAWPETKLTPTLAHEHPDLAADHGVLPWICPECSETFEYGSFEWDGDVNNTPTCPTCEAATENKFPLRGATPENDQPDPDTGDVTDREVTA